MDENSKPNNTAISSNSSTTSHTSEDTAGLIVSERSHISVSSDQNHKQGTSWLLGKQQQQQQQQRGGGGGGGGGGGRRPLLSWGAPDPRVDSFLTVVHANSHSLQIMADRLDDLDLAHELMDITLPHQRFRLNSKLTELDTHLRGWARLFQMLLPKIAEHYRLTNKERKVLDRHVHEINGVIQFVHKLLIECGAQHKQHSDSSSRGKNVGSVRTPIVIRNADFCPRGVTASLMKRGSGGFRAVRRTGNAREAETMVSRFAQQLDKQLHHLNDRVDELADLQHDLLVEARMKIEMDAQVFIEGLRKKFQNGFQSTRQMAQSMRTVEHVHDRMTAAAATVEETQKRDKDKEDEEEQGEQTNKVLPDAETIVQVVQRALDEERYKWQSQLQTQEINLEIEKYHKSVILNKQRVREWRQTVALVIVALLSAGLSYQFAQHGSPSAPPIGHGPFPTSFATAVPNTE